MVLNGYLFQIVEYIQKLTGYDQVSGFSITPSEDIDWAESLWPKT